MDGEKSKVSSTALSTGCIGEDFAVELLEKLGYLVLYRNYHSRYGEIDIIAVKEPYICFVEVKTRRKSSIVSGQQAVSKSKQRKLITTALLYLQQHPTKLQPRFDVVAILMEQGKISSYDYLTGAFDCDGYYD